MLMLSRKPGESILLYPTEKIGQEEYIIDFKIFGIYRNQVKIGVHAPKNIDVHREEIYEKVLREYLLNKDRINANSTT